MSGSCQNGSLGASFSRALPVWVAGREREMNLQVGFRTVVEGRQSGSALLRVTGSSVYRATVNGKFVGYGPARAAQGWFRIDEWDLRPHLRPGPNVVAVEVAGYNVYSFYLPKQDAFLQAEVVLDGRVAAATGDQEAGFEAMELPWRVKKVARYSFQRPFTEAYCVDPESMLWREHVVLSDSRAAPLDVQPGGKLLPRGVACPDFSIVTAAAQVARGGVTVGDSPAQPRRAGDITGSTEELSGFGECELEENLPLQMQCLQFQGSEGVEQPVGPARVTGGEFRTYDFGVNTTGFIRLDVNCRAATHIILTFDEVLAEGDVDFARLGCINVVSYRLEPGEYDIETFEPYTLRYLKIIVVEGECDVREVGLRRYACAGVDRGEFACSDSRLERVFEAGRETFRQNALDIFMDCPSRERAGWLCDSFFTARAEPTLTGETRVERNFIENFLLPERFGDIPEGMLPMCYPADFRDGMFIPNWAMWFVLELEEYLDRTGDRDTVEKLRSRVLELMDFLGRYRNEEGLLEKLPSWVFIEWSAANDFVQDVNYPSNMLYAGTLEAAGRLYGLEEMLAQAEEVRETIRRRSFDGEFFVDNAIRQSDGSLAETDNRTEVCQYYAFHFKVATPESHPELWERLVRDFGPGSTSGEIHPANSFIGHMVRTEALSSAGLAQQIADESLGRLLYMAERTGTLWENVDERASCNHGFAAHVCHTLVRDILGLRRVDRVGRRVQVRFPRVSLEWCEGRVPTPDGPISLRWERVSDRKIAYWMSAPGSYEVVVEETAGLTLEQREA